MNAKYSLLRSILEAIRKEAPPKFKKYYPDVSDTEKLNQAYARCYIHMYLKVQYGILEFEQRERYITDGSYDGGIDAYFIDKTTKMITIIQSKFRLHEDNFESKRIRLDEILAMDIDRILKGEDTNEEGVSYNGKIKQIQREISSIDEISRYRYNVVILANVDKSIKSSQFRRLTGGFPVDIYDYERCYSDLVHPIVCGTYYQASDLHIDLNLTNKTSGSKISYTVLTQFKECDITVLFIPTVEIGRIMNKYKNSILKFNPRSYLEIQGKNVNNEIEKTLLDKKTNEFALFNNGITMLSDETSINERIGQKDKAQLTVKNPQIINGGQTAYTLSKIYRDNIDNLEVFSGKEVLLKVITFHDETIKEEDKLSLIKEISRATNQQSVVTNADKKANDDIQIKIQEVLYDKYGILYERKRGQYSDGLISKYIDKDQILDRSIFIRLFLAAKGELGKSVQRKKVFTDNILSEDELYDEEIMGRFYRSYVILNQIKKDRKNTLTRKKIGYIIQRIYLMMSVFDKSVLKDHAVNENSLWSDFMDFARKHPSNARFIRKKKNKLTGNSELVFNDDHYLNAGQVKEQINEYLDGLKRIAQ